MRHRHVSADVAHHEIENWIAWCWLGEDPVPGIPTRCHSAEGQYTSQSDGDDEGRPSRRIINAAAAQRVQSVYNRRSQLARQILRYEYTQRAAFDLWEPGKEIGPDGDIRSVWIRVANVRRRMARVRLRISRKEYSQHVQAFRKAVWEEFSSEVCA